MPNAPALDISVLNISPKLRDHYLFFLDRRNQQCRRLFLYVWSPIPYHGALLTYIASISSKAEASAPAAGANTNSSISKPKVGFP